MATGEFTATEVSISDPVEGFTVRSWDGPAYKPILDFGTWRIAGLNHAERFSEAARVRKSRHLTTDEAFILLEGEATLYVGDDLTPVKMEKNKVYDVKAGTWHQIATVPGARVLIVENADSSQTDVEPTR